MRLLLGLGGNLGQPRLAFAAALAALARRHRLVAVSALYRSPPLGPPQPPYLNLVALVEPSRGLLELLDDCQELERAAGRRRVAEVRWGPRPLDLDLLLAEGVVHRGPRLELPHPGLDRRGFALVPAAELAPAWVHPTRGAPLAELAAAVAGREGLVCCGRLEGLGGEPSAVSRQPAAHPPGRNGDGGG